MKVACAAIALVFTLTGCTASSQFDRSTNRAESVWLLREVAGARVSPSNEEVASVVFWPDGTLSGTYACNTASGALRWKNDGRFTGQASPIIFTAAKCVKEYGDRTAANLFWNLISDAEHWSISGDILTIDLADGTVATLERSTTVRRSG